MFGVVVLSWLGVEVVICLYNGGMSEYIILIVDDYLLLCLVVVQFLWQSLLLVQVCEVVSVEVLVEVFDVQLDVDLVLFDLMMLGVYGFFVLLYVCGLYLDILVVIFLFNDYSWVICCVQQFGVVGFILKLVLVEIIGEVVQVVFDGGLWFLVMVVECLEVDVLLVSCLVQLILQQFCVLLCLVDGLFNKQIVYELGLVENIVKVYVIVILKKFECYSCIQVVVLVKVLELEGDSWVGMDG